MRPLLATLLPLVAACASDPQTDDTGWRPPEGGRIELDSAGLTLVADYYPASRQDRPAILLFHSVMNYSQRSDWPMEFIDLLHSHDWTVLVPDMRGHGESDGVEDTSWQEGGIHDIEACARLVTADGYPTFAILASTGHEGIENAYAYQAEGDPDIPMPHALGYLSPDWGDQYVPWTLMPVLPSVFAYSYIYTDWSEQMRKVDPGYWVFYEYDWTSLYGTDMFQDVPQLGPDLEAYYLSLWPE